jgi:signal transduction histidine kinase
VATVPPDRYGPALASPLKWQEEVLGAISMGRKPGEPLFSDDEIRLAEQLASEVAIAIHQTQLFEQVRNASERLQLLSQRLLEIQESERRTLARELHDEIGQVLTAVKINLHALKRQPAASTLEAQLDESILITEQALEQVRNMSVDLRPSVLDDLGLVSALRWFLDRQSRRTGFAGEFRAIGVETRLPANLETVCFRVAQESLTNVTRHAQATRVILEVRQADGELQLLIRDDGIGFNVDAARRRAAEGSSFGLLGMEERVVLAGGEFEIASAPKEGTEVRARFKLNP